MIERGEAASRLGRRLEELAAVTRPGLGVTRPGFGREEREAHALVASWAVDDGARIEVDPAGNTQMIYREGEPYFLLGSHLDSVPTGGSFDGAAGVIAALEVADTVKDQMEAGLRVVAFTCEEGAAFGRPCLGSELATGQMDPRVLSELHNPEKQTVSECADALGLQPEQCPAWLSTPAVAAFLELHIEQGAVLEAERISLGVVDTIAGTARIAFSCSGRAGHTGTTPMGMRTDALAAAAELVLAVERVARAGRGAVATVGRLEIEPNAVTTISTQVRGIIDVRDYTDPTKQEAMVREIQEACGALADARQIDVELRLISWRDPIVLSAWPRQALKDACSTHSIPFRVMPSGAGHDAAIVAVKAPTAMLFVPTPGGQSHVPDEACRIADLAMGAEVLSTALLRLDVEARGLETEAS